MVNQSFWIKIREYPGGILQFEKDFKTNFVASIQFSDKTPDRFDQVFLNQPVYKDAYDYFESEHYTVGDLDQIGYLSPSERSDELSSLQIRPADFDAWYEVLRKLRLEGEVRSLAPTDLFKDVMWSVYLDNYKNNLV